MTDEQQDRPGQYCGRCGSKYELSTVIDEAVGRKIDMLATKINTQLGLGEVGSSRSKDYEKSQAAALFFGTISGLSKISAAFIAANYLFPGNQGEAYTAAGLYSLAILARGVRELARGDQENAHFDTLRDRLKAYSTEENKNS